MAQHQGPDGWVPRAPTSIDFSNSQVGKKWGKHKTDFPELRNHIEYQNRARDIFNQHDHRVFDPARNEFQYIRGNDLLRVSPSGTFISLYPGGRAIYIPYMGH